VIAIRVEPFRPFPLPIVSDLMSHVAESTLEPALASPENPPAVPASRTRPRKGLEIVAAAGGSVVAALVLWTLAGFHRFPLWEGWRILDAFRHGASGWWVTPATGHFAGNSVRPLEVFPHQLAYALSPGSFVGFNVVSMLAFAARCFVGYLLLRELLRGHRPAAAVGALLFALSPAADGMMIDRTIHVQWAGALAVGGMAALMIAARSGRTVLAVVSALLASASLLMYEAALPVMLVLPCYLLVAWSTRRRALRMIAIYGAGILLTGAYLLYLRSTAAATYQAGIATLRRPLTDHDGVVAVLDALGWNFGGSVVETLRNDLPMARPALTMGGIAVAVILTVLGLVAAGVLSRRPVTPDEPDEPDEAPSGRRTLLEPLILGAFWVLASLAIFLPFLPYRHETLRVHSIAQFGAVLVFAALLKALLQRARAFGLVLAAIALAGTSVVAVENALMWTKWSNYQSAMVSSLIQQTSSSPTPTVVIDDHTDRLSHIYAEGPSGMYLGLARNMLSGDKPVQVVVCNDDDITAIGMQQMGPCQFTPEGLTVDPLPNYPAPPSVFPAREITVLDLFAGDRPELRRRDDVGAGRPADSPRHTRTPLPCMSDQPCAADAVNADLPALPVFETFDRPYSYEDVPPLGAPVEDLGPIQVNGDTWRWTTSRNAAVYAELPSGRYVVRVRIVGSAVPTGVAAARLSINGRELRTTATPDDSGGTVLEAVGTVAAGSQHADRIGISGPVDDVAGDAQEGLGLAVDWVSVTRTER